MGIVRFKPLSRLGSNEPLATFGLPVMGETNFVAAGSSCEGAAGSVLPPLASKQCASGLVLGPLRALEDMTGVPRRTVALPGLERFWVRQKTDNLCWAAAFETARAFLHLQHISHEEMPNIVANECPKLISQREGAEIYQIAFAIAKINRVYDNNRLIPHACSSERCIIESIARGRPVMILKSSHAVLIQAVEIASGTADIIARYRILDPAGNGNIETRDPLDLCTADAIIAL